jgi:exoribonuclease R
MNTNRIMEDSECIFVPINKNWRDKLTHISSTSQKTTSAKGVVQQDKQQVSLFSQFMYSVKQLNDLEKLDTTRGDLSMGKIPSLKSLTSKNSQTFTEKVEVKVVFLKANPAHKKDILVKLYRDKITQSMMGSAIDTNSKLVYSVDLGLYQSSNQKDYHKYEGKLARCHFSKWAKDQLFPTVMVDDILYDHNRTIESERIILESKYGVRLYDYPATADEESALRTDELNKKIFESFDLEIELKQRKDYRQRLVITVDSDYFENKETTVSIQRSPVGEHSELTLYVVDIEHHFLYGTPLDLEIRKRMMSFNLPEKEYSMMPREITKLLSFKAGKPSLAIAITIPLVQEHGVTQLCFKTIPTVEKCIITPTSRMNYQECESVIQALSLPDPEPIQAKDDSIQDEYISSSSVIIEKDRDTEIDQKSKVKQLIRSLIKISDEIKKLFQDRTQLSLLDTFLTTDILEKEIHKSITGNVEYCLYSLPSVQC